MTTAIVEVVGTPDDTPLDLQRAADVLGVHYQTAYRWVRTGRLPAEMVGGRYLVDRAAVDEFDRARRSPSPPPRPSAARLSRAQERMEEALVAGDEPAVRRLAGRLVDEGTTVSELIQTVLVPPLRRIGERWHDGQLSVRVEHRASAIVERLIGELAPNPRGRRRGTVVVAAPSGDHHSLPTAMAAAALREDHWHVHHFGADLPADEVVEFCQEHDVDVVVLTVTNPAVTPTAEATADRLIASGTPAIVGGRGRTLDDLLTLARDATAVHR